MASNRSKRILQSVLDAKADNIPRKKVKLREAVNLKYDVYNDGGAPESPVPKEFEDELVQLQDLLGDVFNDENENHSIICDSLIDEADITVPDKEIVQPPFTSLPNFSINNSVNDQLSVNRDAKLKKPCVDPSETDFQTRTSPNLNPETTEILNTAEKPENELISSDCIPSVTAKSNSCAVEVHKDLDITVQNFPEKSSDATPAVEVDIGVPDFPSPQQDICGTPVPSPIHCSGDDCRNSFCPHCSAYQTETSYIESEPPTPSTMTSVGSPYTPSTSGLRKKTYKTDKGKKRKAHKENWVVTQRKKLKNSGKSFTNAKGKKIEEKVLKEPCGENCRMKCSEVLDERQRLKIFTKFWSLGERWLQWKYVLRYTKRTEKARKTTSETKHNRQFTYMYYLPIEQKMKVKVCKTMFLNTIATSERIISTAWKKDNGYDIVEADKRGKYDHKKTVIDDEMVKSVCDHVKCFPLVESHRIRKDSNKLYLDGIDSVSRMYNLYCEWEDLDNYSNRARTKRQYRDIVNENFNIAIHRPKKDMCDVCHTFEGNKKPTEVDIKNQEKHLERKEAARKQKNEDKLEALQNEKLVVATFDFQKVLTTPHGEVSILYYKRKLPTLNFTIYNARDKSAKCYMWHEGVAKRGANEVSSCLYSFIKEHAEKGVEEFRFWSDNCSGQNRNRIVFTLYMLAAKEFNVTITHRFLEKGHTQNEGDSVHSVIERACARKMIYVPEEWYCLVRWAKSEGDPYLVHEMQTEEFYNVKELLKNKNWLNNTLNQKVQWNILREVKVNKDQYDRLEYKYEFSQPSKTIVVLRCAGRTNTQRFGREFQLKNAYNGPLPISYDKHKDLMDMCNSGVIPGKYHKFYEDLPHLEKAQKKKNTVPKTKNISKKKMPVDNETDTDTDSETE